jgi:hypothetical protein
MKRLVGVSAIAIVCGIADPRAEERIPGNNIYPVAEKNIQNYSRPRYRRLGYHRSPYGRFIKSEIRAMRDGRGN